MNLEDFIEIRINKFSHQEDSNVWKTEDSNERYNFGRYLQN